VTVVSNSTLTQPSPNPTHPTQQYLYIIDTSIANSAALSDYSDAKLNNHHQTTQPYISPTETRI